MIYGHWDISVVGQFNPEDYYGFVYIVTNITTNRKYIGKKFFWFSGKKQIRNKTKAGTHTVKTLTESDWKTYTTSSKVINAEIAAGEKFTFKILSLHYDKGNIAYAEVETMVQHDVLRKRFADGTREYYNGNIPGVKWIPVTRTELTDETKKKISNKMMGNKNPQEHRDNLSKAGIGNKNARKK